MRSQLTIRSLIIGALGSVIITTSSMYVALRMGALPWPTIFVAVLSMSILKMLGKTNLNEINITHTGMSAGAMVAGGLAFTIPGIWMIDKDYYLNPYHLLTITIIGTILGAIFTYYYRKSYIIDKNLPYPMGVAAYETLTKGDEGGKRAKQLFGAMAITAIFVAFRDWLGKIPALFSFKMFSGVPGGFWVSPMASAIGYLIGPLYTGVWFLGSILGFVIIIPLGLHFGYFPSMAEATTFRGSLGIGLMVGTGFGVLIKGLYSKRAHFTKKLIFNRLTLALLVCAFLLSFLPELSLPVSLFLVIGIWFACSMAALLTGQTGINPMEILGIIVLLLIKFVFNTGMIESFFIAGIVAVAAGLCGDVLNDYKAGYLLKTNPKDQLIAELVGGLVGAVVAVVVLYVMKENFGGFGTNELPAPQAAAVKAMISGSIASSLPFILGFLSGTIFYLLSLPAITLGLGVYLPFFISSTVFLGGFVAYFTKKKNDSGTILASGILGGEGITGVIIAMSKVLGG